MKALKAFIIKNAGLAGVIVLLLGSVGLIYASLTTDRDAPKIFTLDSKEINRTVSAKQLAEWYIENRRDFEVLDLRSPDAFKAGHIKQAISCPVCHQNKADARAKFSSEQELPNFLKKIVVYTQSDREQILLPRVLISKKDLYRLEGGFDAWEKEILKSKVINENDSETLILEKKKANATTEYFTGKTQVAPPTRTLKKIKKRKHVIQSGSNEGC